MKTYPPPWGRKLTSLLVFVQAARFPEIFPGLAGSPVGLSKNVLSRLLVQHFFTGQMPFLSPSQQCQTTNKITDIINKYKDQKGTQ